MKEQGRVSVVITSYNYGRFLQHAIDSVLGQSHSNLEVIVVDDGSEDDTQIVAERYGDGIKYVRQENRGVSKARNRGVEESTGEFLNFLDADDWLLPAKVASQVATVQHDPSLDIVVCGWYEADEDGRLRTECRLRWHEPALKHLLANRSFPPHCALIRKEAFVKIGGFFEGDMGRSWTEDTDLWFRFAASGAKFCTLPEPLAVWRKHSSSISRSEDLQNSYDGVQRMINRLAALGMAELSERRLDSYRRLIMVSFCARFFFRGMPSEAQKVMGELWARWPSWMRSLSPYREFLYRGGMLPIETAAQLLDVEKLLFEDVVPTVVGKLSSAAKHDVIVALLLLLADAAYGLGEGRLARAYAHRALSESKSSLFVPDHYLSLIRSAVGPKVGGVVGRAKRSLLQE